MTLCYNELGIHNDEQEWIDFIYIFFLGRNGDNHQKYNRIRVKIQEPGSSHFSYRETLKISIRTWTSDIISMKGREIILYIIQIIENKVS